MADLVLTLTDMTPTFTPDEAIRHARTVLSAEDATLVEREIHAADRMVDVVPVDQGFLASVMALQPGDEQTLVARHGDKPCGCCFGDGSPAFPG